MNAFEQMRKELVLWSCIGRWIRTKYRTRANESGYYTAARQLRKQGVPLQIALFILL